MLIVLCSGKGKGNSEKSALDNALLNAGICQYNHVLLTSVVPFGATIVSGVNLDALIRKLSSALKLHGSIVYSVMSWKVALGDPVSAGIAISLNPISPFIIEAKGNSIKEVTQELSAGSEEMLYNRIVKLWAENVGKERLRQFVDKEKKNLVFRIASASYGRNRYNAAVSAAVFVRDRKIAKKILLMKPKIIGKTPRKPIAPAGI